MMNNQNQNNYNFIGNGSTSPNINGGQRLDATVLLTPEEIAKMQQSQIVSSFAPTDEELLRAKCVHKYTNGLSAITSTDKVDVVKCTICDKEIDFNTSKGFTPLEIENRVNVAVNEVLNYMEVAKTVVTEMPQQVRDFLVMTPYLKKLPAIVALCVESNKQEEAYSAHQQTHNNSITNSMQSMLNNNGYGMQNQNQYQTMGGNGLPTYNSGQSTSYDETKRKYNPPGDVLEMINQQNGSVKWISKTTGEQVPVSEQYLVDNQMVSWQ